MDYSDINNLLGNLTVSSASQTNTTNYDLQQSIPKTNTLSQNQNHRQNYQSKIQPRFTEWNDIDTSRNTKNTNSIEIKKQTNPDMFLNRNMDLVNHKRHNQYVSLESYNPQRSSMSHTQGNNVNFSQLSELRNNQIDYSQNVKVMDYNLFSENYKNKNSTIENDKDNLNKKMESRGNTPTKPLPYSHKF